MQTSLLYSTMPVTGSLVIARTGQTETQEGFWQCMHEYLMYDQRPLSL